MRAARDLTSAISLSVAEADGIAAGHLNFVFFQNKSVQMSTNANVTFSDSLSNAFLTKNSVTKPANIKYVQCTATLSNIAHWFIEILNVLPGTKLANAAEVSAIAIATVGGGQTTCAIPVFVPRPVRSGLQGRRLRVVASTVTGRATSAARRLDERTDPRRRAVGQHLQHHEPGSRHHGPEVGVAPGMEYALRHLHERRERLEPARLHRLCICRPELRAARNGGHQGRRVRAVRGPRGLQVLPGRRARRQRDQHQRHRDGEQLPDGSDRRVALAPEGDCRR